MSTIALTDAWHGLKPKFETGGRRINLVLGTGGAINQRIAEGETGDVVVSTTLGIQGRIKDGRVVPGTSRAAARSGGGVRVRKCATRPDDATDRARRRALISAAAVAVVEP